MIGALVTFKEVFRIMSDDAARNAPESPEDAVKKLRQQLSTTDASLQQVTEILEAHEDRLRLAALQGFVLSVTIMLALMSIRKLAKELEAATPCPQ